jgi:hypothetical protein
MHPDIVAAARASAGYVSVARHDVDRCHRRWRIEHGLSA